MTLSELYAEVYSLTQRPDKVAETVSAVKAATLKAHQSDFYYKDIFEVGIAFDTSEYAQNLDYRAAQPRWRALKYLRKYDYVNETPRKLLDILLPDQVFDRYGTQKQDICYVAGAFVQINSSSQEQYYLLGCYLNPDINSFSYTSWIAQDHPYAIVYDAVATIFKSTGKDNESTLYRTLVAEQIMMVKLSNVQAIGY